jgi:hypothetical protein
MAIKPQAQASQFGLKLGDSQRPASTNDPLSKLHNQASINNTPSLLDVMKSPFFNFMKKTNPSILDPTNITKYTDNLPK